MDARPLSPTHPGALMDKVEPLSQSKASKLVSNADAAVDGLKEEVLGTLAGELKQIEILLDAAKNKPRDNAAELHWLHDILFEAKALAGTFDYPLISQIGESLRGFLKEFEAAGPTELTIVDHHVRAMSAALRDGHRGDNDELGHAILASLGEAKRIVEGHRSSIF